MKNKYLTLFIVGGLLGYLFEMLVNTFYMSNGAISFFGIPFLPIYGFGLMIMYFFYKKNYNPLLEIFLATGAVVLMELIAGLLIKNQFGRILWDYSDHMLHYQGVISLETTIVWIILAAIVHFIVFPRLE